jgi:hypothetical protein
MAGNDDEKIIDIQKKLDELDSTVDWETARKLYKAKLVARINKGEIGLLPELEQLKKLEERQASLPPEPESPDEPGEVEPGVPERLRFKRSYTLTDKALEARRKNAQKSTGPKTEEGKKKASRNAWKHGLYAQNYVLNRVKPCHSTCPQYPCELVDDGTTQPGGQCLDKAAVIQFYSAICEAVQNKDYSEFNELAAFTLAQHIHTVHLLVEDIQRDGTILKKEKHDKDGNYTGYEVVPHPSLLSLAKLVDSLNITPGELMITPQSIARNKVEKKKAKTLADIFSSFGVAETPDEDA